MNVAIVGSSDTRGGAARSAYRLHCGLLGISIKSTFFTQEKISDDVTVKKQNNYFSVIINLLRPYIDALVLRLYRHRMKGVTFSAALAPTSSWIKKNAFSADVINFHWVTAGFIGLESLRNIKSPVVWTLHDSWVFTGGCHVPYDCDRYTHECGNCPQLGSSKLFDLSYFTQKRKIYFWSKLNLTIVAPSNWLAEGARRSSLLKDRRVEVIPNGIDINKFKVLNKNECRKILNLPTEGKVIIFGAVGSTTDPNKGFQYLQPTLMELLKKHDTTNVKLVVFGSIRPSIAPDMGLETRYIGRLNDDISLNVLYSSADVILVPSIQENLPNVIMESMACGTPAVTFNVGGISDLIDHKINGFMANPFNVSELAEGLSWALLNDSRSNDISNMCRKKIIENFDLKIIAHKYKNLFQELLKKKVSGEF